MIVLLATTRVPGSHVLALFFEEYISFWSVASGLMVRVAEVCVPAPVAVGGVTFPATYRACSAFGLSAFLRKQVAFWAVRLAGIYRSQCAGRSQRVFPKTDESQVARETAMPCLADYVIQARDVSALTLWQRSDEPRPQQSMRRLVSASELDLPISVTRPRADPQPAASSWVHTDFRKHSDQFSHAESRDGEILLVSQARVLLRRVREWLGSRLCISTVPTRSLYRVVFSHA